MNSPSPTKARATPMLPGITYFALVFAPGFLLGTVRTLFVQDAPGAGRLLGVLIELPIMLGALLFGRRPGEHFALYTQASCAPRLAAQIAFALMPLVQMRPGAKP